MAPIDPSYQVPPDALCVTLTASQLQGIVATAVREALRQPPADDFVDQRQSPLGKRRHGDAVRRRLAAGEHGAARIGRRWLLTRSALAEELARTGKSVAPAPDHAAELRAELAAVRGGK